MASVMSTTKETLGQPRKVYLHDAMLDPDLLGRTFGGPTFTAWRTTESRPQQVHNGVRRESIMRYKPIWIVTTLFAISAIVVATVPSAGNRFSEFLTNHRSLSRLVLFLGMVSPLLVFLIRERRRLMQRSRAFQCLYVGLIVWLLLALILVLIK